MAQSDIVGRLTTDQRKHLTGKPPSEELAGRPFEAWPSDELLAELCEAVGIPFYALTADNVDAESYRRRYDQCIKHRFLPLFEEGVLLVAAVLEPWNEVLLEELRRVLEMEVRVVGVTEEAFDQTVATLDGRLRGERNRPTAAAEPRLVPGLEAWPLEIAKQNAFLELSERIIDEAHRRNASDIHLEPEETKLRVRFRINNDLAVMPPIELEFRDRLLEAFRIKASIPSNEVSTIRRGRISQKTSVGRVDLRVECLPTQFGQTIVARLLDPKNLDRFFGRLPFVGQHLEIIRRSIDSYKGLILVTGPTGSGKSTTLLGTITSLDRARLKIATIEDPIEYTLPGIAQTDVSRPSGTGEGRVTFASALRSLLRQDPDVILVGEIRDLDTAEVAIQGADTGHLLFSTLHTNNCCLTVKRMLEMGVTAPAIAGSLTCVVAQRLVEKLCPHCREDIETPGPIARIFSSYKMMPPPTLKTRVGCNQCRNGVVGRLPVFEVLEVSDALRRNIAEGFDERRFYEVWREHGGKTLAEFGLELLAAGETDYDQVRPLIWNEAALASAPER